MKSIRTKLVIFTILTCMLPLALFGIISTNLFTDMQKKKMYNEVQSDVKTIGMDIKDQLDRMKNHMDFIFSSDVIVDSYLKTSRDNMAYKDRFALDSFFNAYLSEKNLREAIIADVSGTGKYVYHNSNKGLDLEFIKKQDWYMETIALNGPVDFVGFVELKDKYGEIFKSFVISRVLKDFKGPEPTKPMAVIVMIYTGDIFEDVYNRDKDNYQSDTVVINDEKHIVSHSMNLKIPEYKDKDQFVEIVNGQFYPLNTFDNRVGGKNCVISYFRLTDYNWTVVKIIPYDFIKEYPFLLIVFMFLALATVALAVMLSYFFRDMIKPLDRLKEAMSKVKTGDFDIKVHGNCSSEVSQIQAGFNDMTEKLKSLIIKIKDTEILKKQEELKALQYQINPHFLYNTLNTIRIMAMIQKSGNISDMVDSLIRLLKSTVENAGREITIEEELNNIKRYVYIHEVRYGDRFKVHYDIGNDTLDCLIPSLVLQPIIENSIFHGLEPKNDIGNLIINSIIIDNDLEITVEDDGVGITEGQLHNIFENNIKDDRFVRIGITNVNMRIKLEYGEEYGVFIESMVGVGTKVIIRLPAKKRA